MDTFNKLLKSAKMSGKNGDDVILYSSYVIFTFAVIYAIYSGPVSSILLAIGVAIILYTVTDGNVSVSLISGALVGLMSIHYSRKQMEGFETEMPPEEEGDDEEEEEEETEPKKEIKEAFVEKPKKGSSKKKKRSTAPPDHGDRAEMFSLGKKYKMPSEEDDPDFHLDAGTTFLNAYKSLKPDQVAAMTKDTQDLMQTQKQLMSTLHTLKPLIKDGKEMMEMFQGYFGSGMPSLN
jgi:hypothetical protein